MTTQALIVPKRPQAMMAVNAKHVNFDILEKVAAALSGSGNRMPGDLLTFKKGKYLVGTGDVKLRKKVPVGSQFVANAPNLVMYWQRFTDGMPVMEGLTYPLIGETMPGRDTLGDTNTDLWEVATDDDGDPIIDKKTGLPQRRDPWNVVVSLMLRDPDDKLYRFETVSYSGKTAVGAFIADYSKEAKRRGPTLLPVVELGADEKQRKGKNDTYDVPVIKIVDWTDADPAIDFPEGGVGIQAPAAEDDGDTGTVATQRVTKPAAAKPAAPKPAPAPKKEAEPAPSKFAKARAEAVDADVVEEDDVPAAPKFGKKKVAA